MERNYLDFFKGKKVTMLGLGLLGRGIGDAKFLIKCGAKLTITDLKNAEELQPAIKELKKLKNFSDIEMHLGAHRFEDFEGADFILKAAGVPYDSQYILHAKKNGVPVYMSTALFTKFTSATVIGITGTRGKSTTTHLIYEILNDHRKSSAKRSIVKHRVFDIDGRVYIGGNVRGISTLAMLPKIEKGDVVVLELDSWQLQGFGDLKISPHIAVFTTFLFDHLNYYKNNLEQYFSDKANIFKFQRLADHLVASPQAAIEILKRFPDLKKRLLIASSEDLPRDWKFGIKGEHNLTNIALAFKVARILGVKDSVIKKTLKTFEAPEGRMQFIKQIRGVSYYNDTTATTPDATLAALKTLAAENRNVVLIMGGADKGLDPEKLLLEIPRRCKSIILLTGTGSEKIKKNKCYSLIKSIVVEAESLVKAIYTANLHAIKGDVVLFSPAFASFGMFQNEFDRGEKFNALIKKI